MIELRWLKGNWEFGRFKLQQRELFQTHATDWIDVPTAEHKPKSLEEKFKEAGSMFQTLAITSMDGKDYYGYLAKIAEEHYSHE